MDSEGAAATKKKKSIFANVQDLAGLNENYKPKDFSSCLKTTDVLDLGKKLSESRRKSGFSDEKVTPAPYIHQPTPLLAAVAPSQGAFFDHNFSLFSQMVELATVAQQHQRMELVHSFVQPFMMNPLHATCTGFPCSPPGGAVLMLSSHQKVPVNNSEGRNSSPHLVKSVVVNSGRSAVCSTKATTRVHGYSSQTANAQGPTALQLPAHPPSTLSLLASGSKASGQPRQPPRFQCPDCNRSYSTFSGLSKHRQFHCTSQLKRQFSCKFCEKQYSSLGALKMHIRTHTLPCKCQMCGKAFSRPWLLQGHLRTHTGEKPFRCGHCGRAFADRSNLRAHLQTHSEIKKYRCKTCQKTFSRMSLLSKHESNGCPGLL